MYNKYCLLYAPIYAHLILLPLFIIVMFTFVLRQYISHGSIDMSAPESKGYRTGRSNVSRFTFYQCKDIFNLHLKFATRVTKMCDFVGLHIAHIHTM